MFERSILIYVFLCFVVGVACLGLVLNLARRNDALLARAFLGAYVALSILVGSTLLLALANAFPDAASPTTRSALEYVNSMVGFYGVMLTLPFFVHRVFGVASSRRDRILLALVAVAFVAQHITEYALNDVWDQRGDNVENVLLIFVVVYVFWVGLSHRKAAGAARPLGDRVLALMALGLPTIVYDLTVAESTGLPVYPLGYCLVSIVVTWTLAQSPAPQRAPFVVDPGWNLSEREQEVLQLVQRGLSNKDIASRLFISPNTVKTHLRSIFEKTGVQSRFELIAMVQGGSEQLDPAGEGSPL